MQLGFTTSATAKLLAAYLERELTEPLVRSELAERHIETAEQTELVYGEYAEIRCGESRLRWALTVAASTRCRYQFSITTGGSLSR
jgi:hypothetical protein